MRFEAWKISAWTTTSRFPSCRIRAAAPVLWDILPDSTKLKSGAEKYSADPQDGAPPEEDLDLSIFDELDVLLDGGKRVSVTESRS